MREDRRAGAVVLAGLVALAGGPARAGDPRAAEVPLAVPLEEPHPDAPSAMSNAPEPKGQGPTTRAEGPAPPGQPPPPAQVGALAEEVHEVGVAVGLGPSAPGTKAEKRLVDALERSARASTSPRARVRRLRAGAGEGATVCRERRDDLVILVEYLPDREDPVLLPQDCRTDRALGVRGAEAAGFPELVGALWAEHDDLVRQGAQERRRLRLGPKLRTGLIVTGAILAVGVAIGAVVAASLRRETVVLTVGP